METSGFLQVSKHQPSARESGTNGQRFRFGPFELDASKHVLTRRQLPLALPPKCFDLLCILVRNSETLLGKDQLMRALWPDTFVEEANLSNLIALLRKALGDSPGRSQYIQTVPRLGYRFVAPILTHPAADQIPAAVPAAIRDQPGIRIIAFPFRTSPGFEDTDRLAYSLPDAISSTLAELNAFVVRSIQAAMRFDPLHWDPATVAEKADIDFILTGTLGMAQSGNHLLPSVQVKVQLIQARDGTLMWAKSWDVTPSELIKLHQSVVQLVVRSVLHGNPEACIPSALSGTPTHSETYNLYLTANQLTLTRTPKNIALARDLYIACVEKDPDFAPAWARLGRCYHFLQKFGLERLPDERLAQKAFERAFTLNSDLILAHHLYTPIQVDMGLAEAAMVRLLNRLSSDRNAPELFIALVHACRYCGLLDASLAAHRRALQLDPNAHTSIAHTYFALGDFERALFWYGMGPGLYLDALTLACMGRNEEAAALLWTRKDRFDLNPYVMYPLEAYLQGDNKKGIAILHETETLLPFDPELRFYMARQAARFSEIDLANELLFRSVEEGHWSTACMLHDLWLEPLRQTAQFHQTFEIVKTREAKSRAAFINAGGERILAL